MGPSTSASKPIASTSSNPNAATNQKTRQGQKRKLFRTDCTKCSKSFLYLGAFLNHTEKKHKNNNPEPEITLNTLELKVNCLDNKFDSIEFLSTAQLAENQDNERNIARKDRLILSGYDCLKQEQQSTDLEVWKCDEEKVRELFQRLSDALSQKLVVKYAGPVNKNNPQSKIEVRLESPEQVSVVKNYFKKVHPMSNISITSYLTMETQAATQVRKSILDALAKELNNEKNYEAAFLEDIENKPGIYIRLSAEDDFKKFTFTDAMSDYQSILKEKNHLLADAYELVQKTKLAATEWEKIFVVLKYNNF